ncbi:MAG: ABC transporter ATP-binding protein [Actinobacteria bacterium]|jgi:oligopeptide/dipeptide ABC transporter ATP-binding protein|nr:ABC transporter ATP-binding protein [Actinomycetota bacterium]
MNSILSIKNLEVGFDTPRGLLQAVRGVDVEVPGASSMGIVGESGSGKTVMCRAAMGLLRGSNVRRSGSVVFDGDEIGSLDSADVRQYFGTGMAMIFQDPMTALNPVRRIGSQLAESLVIRLGMNKKDARARAAELLGLVRIPDPEATLRKFPGQLSGGMRQRVVIATAIACKPKLLFADEPTTALDVTVQAQILELLSDLRRDLDMAMMLVTHDLGVVANHTDYVTVLYAGLVVEQAPTRKLFASMKMPYTEALLKSIPRLDQPSGGRMPMIGGRLPDPTNPEPGCPFAPRCPYVQDRCRKEVPPLTVAPDGHAYRCFYPIGGNA